MGATRVSTQKGPDINESIPDLHDKACDCDIGIMKIRDAINPGVRTGYKRCEDKKDEVLAVLNDIQGQGMCPDKPSPFHTEKEAWFE